MLKARSLAVLAIGLMLGAGQMASAEEVLAPLVAIPVAKPQPVLATDDKQHLAYELMLVNLAGTPVVLKKIEALDGASGGVLYALEGDGLAQMFKLNGGAKGTELPGGGSGILFLDVTLPKDAMPPKALKHRFDIAVASPDAGADKESDRDPAPAPKQELVLTTDALPVGTGAIAVASSLKGKRWVDAARRRAIIAARPCLSTAVSASRSASPSTSCS